MKGNADVIIMSYSQITYIDTSHATYMYRAQFQNREFFCRNNNASNEQFSLALQYVSSSASSALPDKKLGRGSFAPLSRILDALKSPFKVGLSTRGLFQENLRVRFSRMPTNISHAQLYNLTQFMCQILPNLGKTFTMQLACEACQNQGDEVGGSNERCPLTSDFDAKKFTKRSRARL